jgi:capsid protein
LTGGGRLKGRNTTKSDSSHPLSSFRDGMIYELEEGQQLQPFQNNQPGGEYSPFVELNLRLIGMAVRLPYEFLLQYFGGGTFASSKAALEQVHVTVAAWQDWIEDALIRPVIAWRVAEAIRRKELSPAPVDSRGRSEWDRWQWQRPAVMWLDPQAAIQAEMQEIRMGVGTLTAAAAERGLDLEETFRQRAAEMRMAADIEEEYGLGAGSLSDIQIPGQTPTPATPVEETSPTETEAAQ